MPWVRIDDHFDEHPKHAAVGPLCWGVWLAGLAYCNRNLTDGKIPWAKAHALCSFQTVDENGVIWTLGRMSGHAGHDIEAEWVIETLVRAGLWDEVPGAYLVHDYEKFQPTKAQVLAEREQKRAAGSAGGKASAKARAKPRRKARAKAPAEAGGQAESNPVPVPVPEPLIPPLPPHRGGEDSAYGNPRANGTNPRALAALHRREQLEAELRDCTICGDKPNFNCTRCEGRLRSLQEVSS